jgi:hypothetical protein
MNIKRSEITSWIFPIILYFIYPEVGTVFIIIKVVFTVLKVLKKGMNLDKKSSFDQDDYQTKEIKPHDIDFSHDHDYNDNKSSSSYNKRTKTTSFDTEIHVRCPICDANNYIDKIPTECEYCGNQIVKI